MMRYNELNHPLLSRDGICLAFILVAASLFTGVHPTVFSNSFQTCLDQCIDRNLAVPLASGSLRWRSASFSECDYTCHIESCQLGCKDLESLASACDERCAASKSPDSCFQGCVAVSNIFLHQIQYLLDHVTVESKLDPLQGVLLSWTFGDNFSLILQEISAADITWMAQSRVHSNYLKAGLGWKWTEIPHGAFKDSASNVTVPVPVEDSPEVQVRLAAIWRDKAIVSRSFLQTISGVQYKAKKPELLTKVQVSASSFLICWRNDPQVHPVRESLVFHVELWRNADKQRDLDTAAQCHLFRDLQILKDSPSEGAGDVFTVKVSEKESNNAEFDMGTQLEVNVSLKAMDADEASDRMFLFSNGTHILKMADPKDFLMLGDLSTVPFVLPEDEEISALATVSGTRLMVGLTDGSIFSLSVVPPDSDDDAVLDMVMGNATAVEDLQAEQTLIREPDGTGIVQLVVDSVQQKVYAVRNQSGILRCSFKDCANATVLTTNTASYIERIAVDSWNGFLYYATKDGDVFVATLFPSEAPSTYSFNIQRRLAAISPIYSMEVDFYSQKLIAVMQNGSLISMDLVDQKVEAVKRKLTDSEKYTGVEKTVYLQGTLFWTSTECGDDHGWRTCLYGEEKDPDTDTVHLNRYLFAGSVVDVVILNDPLKPPYLMSPEDVGLVLSGNEGRASWETPQSLPFQAPGSSWRDLKYTFKLIDSSTGTVLDSEDTGELNAFIRSDFLPATNYSIVVQACIDQNDVEHGFHACSRPASSSLLTPTNLEYDQPAALIYTDPPEGELLTAFDILGRQYTDENTFFPKLSTNPPDVVAFDNSTRSIYVATSKDISIFRVYPSRVKYRFLDYLTVSYLTILPSRALIIFSTAYQILQYRLSATFDRVIYQCSKPTCAEVVGLASDDVHSVVYYLLQSANGTVSLWEFSSEQLTSSLVSSTDSFPAIRQLIYVHETFVFITSEDIVGTFDKQLSRVHYNYAIVHPRLMLASIPAQDQLFSFDGAVDTVHTGLLEWKTSRTFEEGEVLYKVQLYKDRVGGERTVELSLTTSYQIAASILDSWSSQQPYDAFVDAITPWTVVTMNATELTAPTKPPTAVKNVRIFVTQQKTVDGARAIIDVFWDGPDEWNGDMLGYVVNCSVTDGTSTPNVIVENVDAKQSATYSFSVKSGQISCAVAATNEQNSIGHYSDLVTVDSSDVRPLVRLFAIDSTNDLIAISNWSSVWNDVRVRRGPGPTAHVVAKRQSVSAPDYQGMSFVDNNLYAIRKEDSVQPFVVMLDVNNVNNVLHKVQLNSEFHKIDAVTSDYVANRLLFVAGHDVYQVVLDTFESLSVATPQKVFALSPGAQDAKQLVFDPFSNVAYLLTKNGSLFRLDLSRMTEQNLALSLECLKSETVTSLVADFKWNRASSPRMYALTWNGLISFNPATTECSEVPIEWSKFGDKGVKSILSVALADKLLVFGTANELIIYDKAQASLVKVGVENTPLKQILALSQSSQPYPERTCFQLPTPESINFNVSNEGRSGAHITVIEPVPPMACQNVSFPPTQYEVYFRRAKSDKIKHFRSISNNIHIENGILDKETDYEVYLSWFNRYYTYKDLFSEIRTFRTGYGYPTAPRDPASFALSPDTVLLYWKLPQSLNAPKDEIKYRVSQQSSSLASPVSIGAKQFENGSFSSTLSDIVSCSADPCQAKIGNLRPATDYTFWVTAVHVTRLTATFSEDQEAVSKEATTRTMDVPGSLRLDNVTSDSLLLRWNLLDPATLPQTVDIQYRLSGTDSSWTSSSNSTFDPRGDPVVNITLNHLRSSTAYDFRFVATYGGRYSYEEAEKIFIELFFQPIQQGRTKAGTPSAPGTVEITKERAFWILKWTDPENDGGAPIVSFAVEYRPNKTAEWEIAERGIPSEKMWWKLDKPSAYSPESQFRVRAANSEGFGPYALTQQVEVKEEAGTKTFSLILWLTVVVFAGLAACFAVLFFIHRFKRNEKMKKFKVNKVIKLDDLNMESLEIPKLFQNDLKNLPHVSKEFVIKLDKIGSGSFGEVYQGEAWNLPMMGSKRVPVAIKTLREGHSNEAKVRFVKEAILMNNFDHPNVVKLLGVCFDEEPPQFLILELMEGGDLQNFLRSCRPDGSVPSQITLSELLSIMIDVARGCAYLEMHKHVHRDLAARNCLITSKSLTSRVTKLADFGLARHMEFNEYYRMREQDFLPLRWLAVESALDGVFTTKTDVWAFGVLCWEALSLGEQPYKDIPNSQIVQLLQSDKRLPKPPECPDELYLVMKSCWDRNPELRPSFAQLLRQLEGLRTRPEMRSNSPFPLHQNGYINNGFDESHDSGLSHSDGHHNHRRQQSHEMHASRFDKSDPARRTPALLPSHVRRTTHSASGSYPGSDRPESAISGQTEVTLMCDEGGDDYEIPRNQSVNPNASASGDLHSSHERASSPDKKAAKVSRV